MVAMPRRELGVKNTAGRHDRGEIVVADLAAPFLKSFVTLRPVEAKWRSLNRRMRKQRGGEPPIVDERGAYIREYRRRKWFGGPYAPLRADAVALRELAIHGACRETARFEAEASRGLT